MRLSSFMARRALNRIGFASLGKDVQISTMANFYRPEFLSIGDNVRIDDFAVISVGEPSSIGDWVHLGVSVFISAPMGITIGKFSGLSSGVRVFGSSDEFGGAHLMHPKLPLEVRSVASSKIMLEAYNQVGANSVLLPGAIMEIGSVLGALSLLKKRSPAWKLLAGIPAHVIGERPKDEEVIRISEKFLS